MVLKQSRDCRKNTHAFFFFFIYSQVPTRPRGLGLPGFTSLLFLRRNPTPFLKTIPSWRQKEQTFIQNTSMKMSLTESVFDLSWSRVKVLPDSLIYSRGAYRGHKVTLYLDPSKCLSFFGRFTKHICCQDNINKRIKKKKKAQDQDQHDRLHPNRLN